MQSLFRREHAKFEQLYRHEREKFNTVAEAERLDDEFGAAVASLTKANSRFSKAVGFASVATLLMLLRGFPEMLATAIMLFGAPFVLSSMPRESKDSEGSLVPRILACMLKRDLFADAVWAIALCALFAEGLLRW